MSEPTTDAEVPEALPNDGPDESQAWLVGPPFAMSYECALLEHSGGCKAVIQCDCGQLFKVNLLLEGAKPCPKCDTEYTHILVVTPTTDDAMASDVLTQIMHANGYEQDVDGEDGDGDGDGEGDDGDGDGEGDDGEGDGEDG